MRQSAAANYSTKPISVPTGSVWRTPVFASSVVNLASSLRDCIADQREFPGLPDRSPVRRHSLLTPGQIGSLGRRRLTEKRWSVPDGRGTITSSDFDRALGSGGASDSTPVQLPGAGFLEFGQTCPSPVDVLQFPWQFRR